jgi:hypothetical protein
MGHWGLNFLVSHYFSILHHKCKKFASEAGVWGARREDSLSIEDSARALPAGKEVVAMGIFVYVLCPDCGGPINLQAALENYLDRTRDPRAVDSQLSGGRLLLLPAPLTCRVWCHGCGRDTLTLTLELGAEPEVVPALESEPEAIDESPVSELA